MAIQILNLSFNSIDFHPMNNAGDLYDFNYFNSATEYITEVVLGNKNAFPEFQKQPTKRHILKSISLIAWPHAHFTHQSAVTYSYQTCLSTAISNCYYDLYYNEITPPPPKA